MQIIADRRLSLITFDHRIGRGKLHPLRGIVHAAILDPGIEVDLGRRPNPPLLEFRNGVDDLGAEEFDGAQVIADFRPDKGWIQARTGIFVDQQLPIRAQCRTEEARRGIGQHFIFPGSNVEPENVRNAGIVTGAVKRFAVR